MERSTQNIIILLIILCCYYQYCAEKPRRTADNSRKPKESPIYKLLDERSNDSYIVHFGLNLTTFDTLHSYFEKVYPETCLFGRRRSFSSRMVLALVLTWIRGTMKQEELCMMFGATPATISRGKRLGLSTLHKIFSESNDDEQWGIRWPTVEEMASFNKMVVSNTTSEFEAGVLEGVFGIVDGMNISIYKSTNPSEKKLYYNKLKSDTHCTQIVAFTPDGCICYVDSNLPGSWSDIEIALPLYNTSLTPLRCPGNFRLLADSTFPCKKEFKKKILSVPKEGKIRKRKRDTEKTCAVITKHQQEAEWGKRALQSSFGRLHTRLSADKSEREELLFVVWRLHNLQVRTIGINQIRTVYYKKWLKYNFPEYNFADK